jgi:hypothetical protein
MKKPLDHIATTKKARDESQPASKTKRLSSASAHKKKEDLVIRMRKNPKLAADFLIKIGIFRKEGGLMPEYMAPEEA